MPSRDPHLSPHERWFAFSPAPPLPVHNFALGLTNDGRAHRECEKPREPRRHGRDRGHERAVRECSRLQRIQHTGSAPCSSFSSRATQRRILMGALDVLGTGGGATATARAIDSTPVLRISRRNVFDCCLSSAQNPLRPLLFQGIEEGNLSHTPHVQQLTTYPPFPSTRHTPTAQPKRRRPLNRARPHLPLFA